MSRLPPAAAAPIAAPFCRIMISTFSPARSKKPASLA
jgi:hypothetical protein